MKNWEISCNGWYAYCPECKQESLFRTPICMNCGAMLVPNDEDMAILKQSNSKVYDSLMEKYRKALKNDSNK